MSGPDAHSPLVVDVWVLDLDGRDPTVPTGEQLLSARERVRAQALTAEPHGRRYVSSRVQLRQILASYLEVEPPDVRFASGVFGKPAVLAGSATRLCFNNSRSAGTGLVAVQGLGIEIGVDVETIRLESDLAAVADRFFPPGELTRIAALPRGERVRARYDCWTRIEAELKGIGSGLMPRAQPAAGLDADFDGEPTRNTGRHPDWSVRNLDITSDISAAVAANVGTGRPVRTRVRSWGTGA